MSVLRTVGPLEFLERVYRFGLLRFVGVKAYQQPLTRAIIRLADTHGSFIDIGAAQGDITQSVEAAFNSIIAIEPAPHHISELKRREQAGLLGKTKILNYAVSNKNGKTKLGLSDLNPDDNSLFTRSDIQHYVFVKQKTLDKIISENEVKLPVIIKMDVQGYEGHILKGATNTLNQGCAIIMEFWPWGLERAGTDSKNLLKDIEDNGYQILTLRGRRYSKNRLSKLSKLGKNNRFVVSDFLLVPNSN